MQPLVAEAIRQVFEGEIAPGDLSPELTEAMALEIWERMEPELVEISDEVFLQQFRTNTYVFSAFKNHSFVADITQALIDSDRAVRSFAEFRELVAGIEQNYYSAWLRAEYDTAIGTAQQAARWKQYEAEADVFPMLTYDTVGDDRVRPEHAALDGATYELTDPFWSVYYPPNGWRCRCAVQQSEGPRLEAESTPEVPEGFRHNAGQTAEIVDESHPYFAGLGEAERTRLREAAEALASQ